MIRSIIKSKHKKPVNLKTRSFKMQDVAYGSGRLLELGDVAELCKFNSLLMTPYIYSNAISSGVIQEVKRNNSNIKILVYKALTEVDTSQDIYSSLLVDGVARYNNDRGHSMGAINSHPDWFVLDSATGDRIYNNLYSIPPGKYQYLLDFSNPDVSDYMLEAIQTDFIDTGWSVDPDGIYVDICFALPSPDDYPGSFNKPINTNQEWLSAMNGFVSRLSQAFSLMGLECQFNRGYTRDDDGELAWDDLENITVNHTVMEEVSFASSRGSYDCQIYSKTQVENQIKVISKSISPVVCVSSLDSSSYDNQITTNRGGAKTARDVMKYCYGCFLISYKVDDYFSFKVNGYGYPKAIDLEDELSYIDMGLPLSNHKKVNEIYCREFENGYVYVNHTNNNVKIYLNESLHLYSLENKRLKNNELPLVNSILTEPCTAYFLFKA